MSKINDLIRRKCPNGVPFYRLYEIGNQFNGLSGKSKKDFQDGNCRFITYTNIYNNPSTRLDLDDYVNVSKNEKQNKIEYKDILVAGSSENLEDSGMISVVTSKPKEDIYLNSFCFGFRLNGDFYNKYIPDFLKHLFRDTSFRNEIILCSFGVTRYNLSKEKFLKIKIPCPPIEVQEEIVRILDKFTELEAELETELEARKQQYEFWLGKMFDRKMQKVNFSEAFDIKTGKGITKKDSSVDGIYPIISGGKTEMGFYDTFNRKANTTTISRVGANAGFVNFLDKDFYLNDKCFSIIPKEKYKELIDPKYIYYFSKNIEPLIMHLQSEGGVPTINTQKLGSLEFGLLPLDEQKKIISLLDKFDKLVNDITEGIPAEIKLRRKQYEYYRNKLLSFEELIVNE